MNSDTKLDEIKNMLSNIDPFKEYRKTQEDLKKQFGPIVDSINSVLPKCYFDSNQLNLLSDYVRDINIPMISVLDQNIENLGCITKRINATLEDLSIGKSILRIQDDIPTFLQYQDIYNDEYHKLIGNISDNKIIQIEKDSLKVVNTETNEKYDLVNEKDIKELPKLFKDLNESEIISFLGHITRFPYLGYMHPVGKKIFEELKSSLNAKKKTLHKNTVFYRTRLWNDKQTINYTEPEMWTPPKGCASMGRFNPPGISYLYLALTKETAIAELKKENKYTLMETCSKETFYYVDFSNELQNIFGFCNKKKESTTPIAAEYLIPNFIAQCIAYLNSQGITKINGIKYKSVMNPKDFCFVFFDKDEHSFYNSKILVNN